MIKILNFTALNPSLWNRPGPDHRAIMMFMKFNQNLLELRKWKNHVKFTNFTLRLVSVGEKGGGGRNEPNFNFAVDKG